MPGEFLPISSQLIIRNFCPALGTGIAKEGKDLTRDLSSRVSEKVKFRREVNYIEKIFCHYP